MSTTGTVPTQITIRPDREVMDVARFPSSATRLAGQRYQFGSSQTTADARFFGEDGAGIEDVVDALNPLNHIPFVNTLYEQATGHTASTASKLIGGALIGGPIGFLAALGNVIFEQETGHSAAGAVVAALTGEETAASTQVAAVETPSDTSAIETPVAEVLPPAPKQAEYVQATQEVQTKMASAIANVGAPMTPEDRDTLMLFGDANMKSAHDSYRKAQFTPYLTDVTTSMVM